MAQNKRVGWVLIVVAVFGYFLYFAAVKAATSDKVPTAKEDAVHNFGETVTIGEWSYLITKQAHWKKSFDGPIEEQPDARFLVVDLAVRNNDKTASILPPLKLVDPDGNEYSESSQSIFLHNPFGPLKQVNPGVTSSGAVLFDVPSNGHYRLLVSGGFGSNQHTQMRLAPLK